MATPTVEQPEVEREIRQRITPAERFRQEVRDFAFMIVRVGGMMLVLTPVLLIAILTIDIPVRFLNGLVSALLSLRPSQWLTWGHLVLAVVLFISLLFTRRWGGTEASRAVLAAWGAITVFVLFELSVLSPVIESSDFPSARFTIALVSSAMTGQLVAIAFYDVARGGGAWWRAPFYAAMTGLAVAALIYFPIAYWNSTAPWAAWMVVDLMIKMGLTTLFLPIYAFLRRALRPRGGYGGH